MPDMFFYREVEEPVDEDEENEDEEKIEEEGEKKWDDKE